MMLRGDRLLRRYLALAQCGLLALAVVGAHAHRALIRHGYCTDHGELIHPTEKAHALAAAPMDRAAVAPLVHLEGAHGCALLEFLTQTSMSEGSSFDAPRPLRVAESPAAIFADDHASIPLLRQSPKHSPPHA